MKRLVPLVIHVQGEHAATALCDCLHGWTCKRASRQWWHVHTTAVASEVRTLIDDLRIRAIVKEVTK